MEKYETARIEARIYSDGSIDSETEGSTEAATYLSAHVCIGLARERGMDRKDFLNFMKVRWFVWLLEAAAEILEKYKKEQDDD